jgi:hypothetical protein
MGIPMKGQRYCGRHADEVRKAIYAAALKPADVQNGVVRFELMEAARLRQVERMRNGGSRRAAREYWRNLRMDAPPEDEGGGDGEGKTAGHEALQVA